MDSKLISKAHFIQSIKVNIVPSHTNSPACQSIHVCFSTMKGHCNLQLLALFNFSSLFSMEEEVDIQDVFKTASSAQKSLIWKYYLISTMKNTATHHHCAKCCYCNLVQDGKVQQCMQKHMLNCEKVGHEDKAQLYHHLRSLPALPQDIKEEVDDDNSLAMSSSQSSSVVLSFSSSTTLNKLQTGIQSYHGPVKLSIQMENDFALSLLCAIIVGHVSLNFADSFYFEECIQKIKPKWIVPPQQHSWTNM